MPGNTGFPSLIRSAVKRSPATATKAGITGTSPGPAPSCKGSFSTTFSNTSSSSFTRTGPRWRQNVSHRADTFASSGSAAPASKLGEEEHQAEQEKNTCTAYLNDPA